MVQYFNPIPTPTNASMIGNALGQGIAKNFPDPQQMVQRGMLQEALQQAKSQIEKPGASRLDALFGLMQAGAGIPGSEKYLSTILPEVMKGKAIQDIFGTQPQTSTQQPQKGIGQQQKFVQPGMPTTPGIPGLGETAVAEGQPQPGQATTAGVLPRIMPAEEIQARSQQNAISENDPNRASFWQDFLNNQNQIAQKARQAAETKALDQGVTPEEMPEFMQLGQKYGYMTDLDNWAKATSQDFKQYKDAKTQLDAALIPKFFTGLVKGPQEREATLKRLDTPVQELVRLGQEQYARKKLAEEGLSRTEIEERIHPLPDDFNARFKQLPKGPFKPEQRYETVGQYGSYREKSPFKSYDEVLKTSPKTIESMNKNLANWLGKNLTQDMPLSVIRHKVWNDKHYDWRQFPEALSIARKNGLKLSASQQAELAEISTQAPRQSLSDIFTDWGRWIDYFKGVK